MPERKNNRINYKKFQKLDVFANPSESATAGDLWSPIAVAAVVASSVVVDVAYVVDIAVVVDAVDIVVVVDISVYVVASKLTPVPTIVIVFNNDKVLLLMLMLMLLLLLLPLELDRAWFEWLRAKMGSEGSNKLRFSPNNQKVNQK